MKIETNQNSNFGLLSSAASNSSTDEMIENENQAMRDRVADLEKRVLEQNDEIMCLRSTLADALRRITSLEGIKSLHPGDRSSSMKDGLRLRSHLSDSRDSPHKRASSYIPGRGTNSTPSSARTRRAPPHYQSTSSLYSDGHSSSSASPAPSPSPTSASNNGPSVGSISKHNHSPHTSAFASPSHSARSTQQSNTALNKRWASASDFNSSPNGTPSGYHEKHSPSNKRNISGSLHNLSSLRVTTSTFGPLRHGKEALYNAEEGVVKMYLRGRPLNYYIPSDMRESYQPQKPSSAPGAKLKLEWVYGYRGRDCRNNVHLLPTGEIVYFVASVVVLYNVEEQSQRHYLGHTDDIKCLAVHPNRMTIATGQAGGHDRKDGRSWRLNPPADPYSVEAEEWPHIRIWDSVSLSTLHILGISDIEKSVACLAFSRADGGGLLVAVDEAPDHNMSVWDWSKGERGFKLMETKCAADQVLSVEFSPLDRNTIITCGKNQLAFWVYESGMLAKRVGIFENRERPKYVTAISFTDNGNVISGDSNGNLLVWQRGGNRVERSVKGAHDGSIFSIFVQKDGTIITGGKDGRILEWGRDLRKTGKEMMVPEHFGAPRVVTSGKGTRLVIGTTKNCVLGGTFSLPLQPLMQGHTEELWALAPHPSQNQFLTAGYDKVCYLWDTMAKAIVWSKEVGDHVQAASFSKNGEIVVVAMVTGRWVVMDAETREMYSQHQDTNEPIQVVQFSPNGKFLALGSRDNNIYVYQVSEGCRKYSRLGRCQGHSSSITHLDWSKDSQYLRSNSGDYELLFWNVNLCRQVVQPSQMRDVEWATNFCPLSFTTLGIWGDGDGTDINSCAKANNYDILASGDDFGKIKLFAFPSSQIKARHNESAGHSSHVTCVRFLHNDTRLLSVGGRDTAILQWMVTMTTTTR
ncbi:UNVERIFIED_CONTAM: hypothetical protein RMT77_007581 [Armadillidium vulgare]